MVQSVTSTNLIHDIKLKIMLTQIDLDDALLEFNKMPTTWMLEKKQCRNGNAHRFIFIFKSYSSRHFEGENYNYIIVEI